MARIRTTLHNTGRLIHQVVNSQVADNTVNTGAQVAINTAVVVADNRTHRLEALICLRLE
jgi:hypothetical protein